MPTDSSALLAQGDYEFSDLLALVGRRFHPYLALAGLGAVSALYVATSNSFARDLATILLISAYAWGIEAACGRVARRHPHRGPARFRFGPKGFDQWSRHSAARYAWGYFTNVKETRSAFILSAPGGPCVLVMKRFLASPADVERVRELFAANIPARPDPEAATAGAVRTFAGPDFGLDPGLGSAEQAGAAARALGAQTRQARREQAEAVALSRVEPAALPPRMAGLLASFDRALTDRTGNSAPA